jgi:hypothetical protein
MEKSIGKKRGRPRKPVLVVNICDVQSEWNARLKRAGNPLEKASNFEIAESNLPSTERDNWGRKVRPTKVSLGESWKHKSFTQPDPLVSLCREAAEDQSVVLSAAWMRYLEYMDVIAEARYHNEKCAVLKQLFLQDARSRSAEQPPEIPAELGTPADFEGRLADHELEIRYEANRREHAISIRVYPLPPHEDEDLDEGDEKGHWEGLTWFPDRPQ